MPQLYLNPNSVIETVSNEDIYEEIQNETKIKKGTVRKILSEEIVLLKKFEKRSKKFSFDKNLIHEKINEFHKKTFPTIRDIFNEIKGNENSSFEECSDQTFRKLIKKNGIQICEN